MKPCPTPGWRPAWHRWVRRGSCQQGPRGLLLALGAPGLTLGLVLWMRRRDYRASQREYDTRALDD